VFYLIILQASIGFVNGIGAFSTDYVSTVSSEYYNVDISKDIPVLNDAGGALDRVVAISTVMFDMGFAMLRLAISVLGSIVVIYPTIVQMFPFIAASPQAIALLVFLQIGIWITYMFFLYQLYKGSLAVEL
jgi:hypothetical protein